MVLLPIEVIQVNEVKISRIDQVIKAIYRLIIYSREHLDDDLLDTYLSSIHDLRQLLSIKNAQMEAQDEDEAREYLKNLQVSLVFVVQEINTNQTFSSEVQLFQLLRLISPETNAVHPNRYRHTLVQVGAHVCPEPASVPGLVGGLMYQLEQIPNPIIRAIYLHHELIRIHPFADGNGRVARIAKNWILMFDLYPPIFINDAVQKKEYITTLAQSFRALAAAPGEWNEHTAAFFEQELDRLLLNAGLVYEAVREMGEARVRPAG